VPDNAAIVVIGGGHAAAQLCAALVAAGAGPRTHLVCAEAVLPYQRPPLSKAFLKNPDDAPQLHRAEAWFAEHGIHLHLGDAATGIDRSAQTVTLASGAVLPYGQLVLATGALARTLPGLGSDLANVAVLRHAADAQRLRSALQAAASVTVLGGGFIGLEIAATAQALGKATQVLEAAPRLLQRAVSPELSAHVLASHQAAGIAVTLNARVSDIQRDGDHVSRLSVNGQPQAVDLLVLGVGALPDTALAQAAGLACDDGVLVDAQMRSSDPRVLAIGDCARFSPHAGGLLAGQGHAGTLRLESVQNASDQARTAAATLLGRHEPYNALPWFWSEQGTMRLQMAGLMPVAVGADGVAAPAGQRHRRPGANDNSFSLLHYVDGRLVCVESVNAAMDHMMARKILEAGKHPTPTQACDPALPLKQWV
jgi:3-phenylpropionate/trans-cinnamate dioxygenase ferredoxin reductase subunit